MPSRRDVISATSGTGRGGAAGWAAAGQWAGGGQQQEEEEEKRGERAASAEQTAAQARATTGGLGLGGRDGSIQPHIGQHQHHLGGQADFLRVHKNCILFLLFFQQTKRICQIAQFMVQN